MPVPRVGSMPFTLPRIAVRYRSHEPVWKGWPMPFTFQPVTIGYGSH
jgi:hypothetical protein